MGHSGAQKTCNISETVQDRTKVLLWTNRKSHTRFRLVPKSVTLNNLERRIQGLHKVFKYALLSQERVKKATDFKFGRYIHRVHPNKRPLKILGKRERGRIQGAHRAVFFAIARLSCYICDDLSRLSSNFANSWQKHRPTSGNRKQTHRHGTSHLNFMCSYYCTL